MAKKTTDRSLPARIAASIGVLDLAFESLRIDPLGLGVQIVDAARVVEQFDPFDGAARAFDPTRPALLCQIDGQGALDSLRKALLDTFPGDHPVSVVRLGAGAMAGNVRAVTLAELDRVDLQNQPACVYLTPIERLADLAGFDTLREIVARLRAPHGCPWDREQTHQSMKKHFIEETYEAIAALDENDWAKFTEELGDVLLQVVMHCQLGREARSFELEDVLRAVNEKLIRRHPHVFGDVQVGSSADVLRNWEKIKRAESGVAKSSFASIPPSIPALMRADAVQSRATRYGWTPPTNRPNLTALERPGLSPEQFRQELGEALFEVVALTRRHDVDPEEALRLATNQFADRLEGALTSLLQANEAFDTLPAEKRRRLVQQALDRTASSGT